MRQRSPFCVVTNTTVSALELRRSRTACPDYWNRRRVTNHILKELGYEVTLVNHVDSQSAKAWASNRGSGRRKHVMLKYMVVQDVVEKKQTTLLLMSI